MNIKRVELTNIRCFDDIRIDLSSDGGIRKWAVILGDNGVGKTTLLRSIALALGDRESAAALLRDLPGEWVRRESTNKKGIIRVDFSNKAINGQNMYTQLLITNKNGRESIEQYKSKPENFPLDDVFACGYGAGRTIIGTRSYPKYRTIDSVYSLFDYEMPLQNTELTLRRLDSRVRTHYSHQMTAAARAIAAMKFLMLRSKRVAIRRQSLRRQNMRSMMLRCL